MKCPNCGKGHVAYGGSVNKCLSKLSNSYGYDLLAGRENTKKLDELNAMKEYCRGIGMSGDRYENPGKMSFIPLIILVALVVINKLK